jgi:hypothetical protein
MQKMETIFLVPAPIIATGRSGVCMLLPEGTAEPKLESNVATKTIELFIKIHLNN